MKKSLQLAGLALVAAMASTFFVPQLSWARPTNAWNFATLLLQSNQTLTVQGPANFTGKVTFGSGSSTLMPIPAVQTMAAGDGINADACGGVKQIASASAITSSTTFPFPLPATTNAGCDMSVVNVGASSITIKAAALEFFPLNAADVVLGSSSTLTVISNGSFWYQTGGTVNR